MNTTFEWLYSGIKRIFRISDKGIYIPKYSQTEINAIAASLTTEDNGLIWYNTSRQALEYWDGTSMISSGVITQVVNISTQEFAGTITYNKTGRVVEAYFEFDHIGTPSAGIYILTGLAPAGFRTNNVISSFPIRISGGISSHTLYYDSGQGWIFIYNGAIGLIRGQITYISNQ